jgi:hypothetical protein
VIMVMLIMMIVAMRVEVLSVITGQASILQKVGSCHDVVIVVLQWCNNNITVVLQ